MTTLTAEDQDIISRHALEVVNHDALKPAFDDRITSPHTLSEQTDLKRSLILDFLSKNLRHPVVLRTGRHGRMLEVYNRVDSCDLDVSLFEPLMRLVASRASDLEIWSLILRVVDTFDLTPSVTSSYSGTPLRRGSGSIQHLNQKREELRKPIELELQGRVYEDATGFIKKYFENPPISERLQKILAKTPSQNLLQNLSKSSKPTEKEFWTWLNTFQEEHLCGAPNRFHRTLSKSEVVGATGERQFDILLELENILSATKHDVKDCLMVGEVTEKGKGEWKKKFIQLATYVRDVFNVQPIRYFVHGFLLFGTEMQLWVFNRSGAYGSPTFDIRQDPQQLIRVLIGYAWMSSEELGLNPLTQQNRMITLLDPVTEGTRDFELRDKHFFHQQAIACRGTTCYRTMDEKYVVKFSWRADKPQSEIDHLKKIRGVRGTPSLVGSREIMRTADLQEGLGRFKLRSLGHVVHERSASTSQPSVSSQSESLGSNGTKRKSGSGARFSSKRSRSNTQRSVLDQEIHSSQTEQPLMLTVNDCDVLVQNRVLTCVAMTPAGHPLDKFKNVCEVLKAFRDTIKAHKVLFQTLNILHRDISHGNIVLTEPREADGCSGMLIDYDLAVQIDDNGKNGTSREKNMTGTLEFIAIEILEGAMREDTAGIERTYRHDLESFFYVFLALCIRYNLEGGTTARSEIDPLQNWYTGEYGTIAQYKRGAMTTGGFELHVLDKFTPTFSCIKDLARTLRGILFVGSDIYTGTPSEPEKLYRPMIAAFENVIESYG